MNNTDTAWTDERGVNAHALLQGGKQYADEYLNERIKEVFDKADSTLFEYGDKSGGVGGGNDYFGAMRELRRQRQELIQYFFETYTREYSHRLKVGGAAPEENDANTSGLKESWSLIGVQDLEESLAIEAAVIRAKSRFRNEIYALTQRYNLLVEPTKLEEDYHPLGPDVLGRAFRDTFQGDSYPVAVKLIVYKLFDQWLMKDLNALYVELNGRLARAGILSQLKPVTTVRNADSGTVLPLSSSATVNDDFSDTVAMTLGHEPRTPMALPAIPAPSPTMASSVAYSEDIYQMLQHLMNLKKSGGSKGSISTATEGDPLTLATLERSHAIPMPVDELLQGLTQLQQSNLSTENKMNGGAGIFQVKHFLLAQSEKGTVKGLHPVHDNIMDVIGMIFEFILDEPSIPEKVKTLLSALQIPILKIAILDREFFTNKSHPARRLLNVLGHASIGWDKLDPEFQERHYAKMEHIVGRALREYEADSALFAELLVDFTSFLTSEAESNIEEPQVLDEIGQDEPVGRRVFEAIETRLEPVEVPALLRDFLRSNWRTVLERTLEVAGYDSGIWHEREKVVDTLIWSMQSKTDNEDRRLMATALPRLLTSVRDGMNFIGRSPSEIETIIDGFQPIHMACLRGERPGGRSSFTVVPASKGDEACCVKPEREGVWEGDDSLSDFEKELLGVTCLEMPEPVATPLRASEEDEFLMLARNMCLGVWLEFEQGNKKKRAKLAWKSVVLEQYVFVDRKYKVVMEKTLLELAADLREGRATVCEDLAMFDRALDKVLNNLMSAVS